MCAVALRNSSSDDGAGDAAVGGDREGVAGVVVEPVEDLHVGAVGQPPVGEVGLPAFVGLLGGEADVGRFGSLLRCGCDQPGRVQVAVDRGRPTRVRPWWCSQVPGDGVWPVVEAFAGQLVAQFDDQIDRQGLADKRVGLGCGRLERGSNAASPSSRYRLTRREIQPWETLCSRATSDLSVPAEC